MVETLQSDCDQDVTMLEEYITFSVDMTIEDGPSSRLGVRALIQMSQV